MKIARRKILLEFLNNKYFNLHDIDDKSLDLYNQALTHSSFAKEQRDKGISCEDNERLEFFGNFVLGLVVSEHLYKNFEYAEGEMTKRMVVVSDAKIAEIIKRKKLGIDKKLVLLGKRELHRSKRLENSIIACAFEAVIGAIYLDRGLEKVKDITIKILGDEIRDFELESNFIGRLQELVQQNKLGELEYEEKKLTGPDHKPTFQAVVRISNKRYGKGTGKNKKAAKMAAAKSTLEKFKKLYKL